MIKYLLSLLLLFFIVSSSVAQSIFGLDTITVMQYNLCYFNSSSTPGGCSVPDGATRAGYISTILDYVKPDVFGVNEMANNEASANLLLNSAVNSGNRSGYLRAPYLSGQSGSIANMIFYNPKKLKLINTTFTGCSPRRVDIYSFEHVGTTAGSSLKSEVTRLHFLIAHLKAGNTPSDNNQKGECAQNVINFLNNNYSPNDNFFFMGDFNLYTSAEVAWFNMTNTAAGIHFVDPINRVGNWSGNASFADIHTQSPHVSAPQGAGCYVGGGLNDRFDFILTNKNVINGSRYVTYIPNSYKAVGNNGNLFKQAINNPGNTSVPANVISALYNNSDHIPVTAKFKITLSTVPSDLLVNDYSILPNPFNASYEFDTPNMTLIGDYNTVTGIYKTFGTNGISLVGTNLYITSSTIATNLVTFTGTYTISGSKMNIAFSQLATANIEDEDPEPNTEPEIILSSLTSTFKGTFYTNGSEITIINTTNTIVGTYRLSLTDIKIEGSNQYFLNSTFNGLNYVTITGLRTISGSHITVSVTSLMVSDTAPPIVTTTSAILLKPYVGLINPFDENIKLSNLQPANWHVELINTFGVVLLSENVVNTHIEDIVIDTRHIKAGLYVLVLKNESGNYYSTKLIKRN